MKNKIPCFPCLEAPRCRIWISIFTNQNEIENISSSARITCDSISGKVSRANGLTQQAEWYIEEHHEGSQGNPNGSKTLKNCANGKYLVSDVHGTVSERFINDHSSGAAGQELWIITKEDSSSSNQKYLISSTQSGRYLTCDKGNGNICTLQKTSSVLSHPFLKGTRHQEFLTGSPNVHIEFLSGELCFISSPWSGKQLSCSSWAFTKNPSMSNSWTKSEIWRFIEAGDDHVRIMSMRWDGTSILSSDKDGNVYTTTDSQLGHNESKWSVDLVPETGVTIKSVLHNRYLQVASGETISTSDCLNGSPSIWHLSAGNRQEFFISSSAHKQNIGHKKGGSLDCTGTSNCGFSEVWEVQHQDHTFVSLKSNNHDHGTTCKFLNSDQDGNLYETDTLGDNGLWRLEQSPTNCMNNAILSEASGGYLSCKEKDYHLCTRFTEEIGNDELWNLIPILPGTIKNKRHGLLSIIGGSAVGMVVAPVALVGAVGFIGFGTAGISGGSIAAAMMSLGGGSTAAGGTVATLQSIGAIGLSAAGTTATMSAGAVVMSAGAVVGGKLGAVERTKPSSTKGAYAIQIKQPRPFCNWKSW